MQREIILDTETTGMDPKEHRLIEIGCIEMIGGARTGKFFHSYFNPQRDVSEGAFRVHGISESFLRDKPLFAEKAEDFLAFIEGARLVIHNASFDMGFVNAELTRVGFAQIGMTNVIDTVLLARKKFPGSPANLDALCKRFEIDLSQRTKHGALLDAELLAEVYIELLGGRQVTLVLESEQQQAARAQQSQEKTLRPAREFPVDAEELAAHMAMLAKIKNPLWAA